MYTFFVKRPVYSHLNRTQTFRSWKPGSANTLIGQRIGRFQFTNELDRSDNISRYHSIDIEDDTAVIIHLFSPELSQNTLFATQFKTGMRQAQTITNDLLVPIHEAGMSTGEQLYFVTDYVNGTSLHEWVYADDAEPEYPQKFADAITQQRQIAAERDAVSTVMSLRFAEQMGQHLRFFEENNIAHQNLSLSQFVIQPDDRLMLLGYGLPTLPAPAKANGHIYSLAYTPPEQAVHAATTIHSNIYSLGVMLYEMLAGSRPLIKNKKIHGARAFDATWRVQLADVKEGLSSETYELVNRCLHSQPWNRFGSITELQAAIATALQIETAVAEPFLNQETVTAAIDVSTETAVSPTIPTQPEIKPVKPVRKSQPKTRKKPLTPAETLAKAAILPQADSYEEESERAPLVFILPIMGVLLFLITGGIFFFTQSTGSEEPDAAPIAAVPADENVDATNDVERMATPAPPTLEIVNPVKNSDYMLSDLITFRVRWPQPLAENAELRINLQENTWGNGDIIGVLAAGSEGALYELTIPVSEFSSTGRTLWWQILLDADGNGPKLGVPLSELRPFNIVAITATTAPTVTPSATAMPSNTPTPKIACIPNPDWIAYTIKSGDNLFTLAQQTGTTTEAVLEANCLEENPVLSIDQTILLPRRVATATPTPTATSLATATPTATPTQFQPAPAPSEPTDTPAPPPTATVPPVATNPPTNPGNPPTPTNPPPGGPTATIPPPPTAVPPTNTPAPPPDTPVPPPDTPVPTSEPTEPTAAPTSNP